MTGFEFSMIPVAIVIGFAITRLLNNWAQIFVTWDQIKNPFLYLSFSSLLLFGILSHFVGDWPYRNIELNLGRLSLIILPALVMILGIASMVPQSTEFSQDLEKHYFERIRLSATLMGTGILLGVVPDMFPGVTDAQPVWMVLLFVAPMLLMAMVGHRLLHMAVHLFIWALLIIQLIGLTGFGRIQ